jgi:hypothetical protein
LNLNISVQKFINHKHHELSAPSNAQFHLPACRRASTRCGVSLLDGIGWVGVKLLAENRALLIGRCPPCLNLLLHVVDGVRGAPPQVMDVPVILIKIWRIVGWVSLDVSFQVNR